MAKNIVVCCDGTSNEYGTRNTNVVKLFSVLQRDTMAQLAFYDPGVGTLTAPLAITAPVRFLRWVIGLAFGYGIVANAREAYRYLMRTYEPQDRVFIFGFSRGAYTARLVAAMIHKCGLLMPNNDSLIPYVVKMFKHTRNPRISNGFRATFSRKVPIHFLGLWDTVSSVGWVYNPDVFPFTATNESVQTVRHAIAIDERRCFFRQNTWHPTDGQDVLEVWFPGCHADVGGSLPDEESGLSQLALQWMLGQAKTHGLLVDASREAKILPAQRQHNGAVPPDPNGDVHESLRGAWWIPEFIPKLYRDPSAGYRKKLRIPLARRRAIPEGAIIHASVRHRANYPVRLPEHYSVTGEPSPAE